MRVGENRDNLNNRPAWTLVFQPNICFFFCWGEGGTWQAQLSGAGSEGSPRRCSCSVGFSVPASLRRCGRGQKEPWPAGTAPRRRRAEGGSLPENTFFSWGRAAGGRDGVGLALLGAAMSPRWLALGGRGLGVGCRGSHHHPRLPGCCHTGTEPRACRHPSPATMGGGGKCPKCRRSHPERALPGRGTGTGQGPWWGLAVVGPWVPGRAPARARRSVPVWPDPGVSSLGSLAFSSQPPISTDSASSRPSRPVWGAAGCPESAPRSRRSRAPRQRGLRRVETPRARPPPSLGLSAPLLRGRRRVRASPAPRRASALVFRVKRAKAFKNNIVGWNFPTDRRRARWAARPCRCHCK